MLYEEGLIQTDVMQANKNQQFVQGQGAIFEEKTDTNELRVPFICLGSPKICERA